MATPTAIVYKQKLVFFTTNGDDHELISNWLTEFSLDRSRFYASFLNYAIATVQRTKENAGDASQSGEALIEVLEEFPAQTKGFLDAMEAYAGKQWKGGVSSGLIDLGDERKATEGDISKAHARLTALVLSKVDREQFSQQRPDLSWLVSTAQASRKQKKKTKRAEQILGGLSLADDE